MIPSDWRLQIGWILSLHRAPIDPMGTLEPYLGPIRPMLLIPNGAAPVISPAGTLASSPFPGLLRLIWLTISLPLPCATYDNPAAGSVVPFRKRSTDRNGGVLKIRKSIFVGSLLVVSKHATGLYMGLGVHIKQKITISCPR